MKLISCIFLAITLFLPQWQVQIPNGFKAHTQNPAKQDEIETDDGDCEDVEEIERDTTLHRAHPADRVMENFFYDLSGVRRYDKTPSAKIMKREGFVSLGTKRFRTYYFTRSRKKRIKRSRVITRQLWIRNSGYQLIQRAKKETGIIFSISQAFRSRADQKRIRNGFAAPLSGPKQSLHFANAFDIPGSWLRGHPGSAERLMDYFIGLRLKEGTVTAIIEYRRDRNGNPIRINCIHVCVIPKGYEELNKNYALYIQAGKEKEFIKKFLAKYRQELKVPDNVWDIMYPRKQSTGDCGDDEVPNP